MVPPVLSCTHFVRRCILASKGPDLWSVGRLRCCARPQLPIVLKGDPHVQCVQRVPYHDSVLTELGGLYRFCQSSRFSALAGLSPWVSPTGADVLQAWLVSDQIIFIFISDVEAPTSPLVDDPFSSVVTVLWRACGVLVCCGPIRVDVNYIISRRKNPVGPVLNLIGSVCCTSIR